jgi:hypothetical protein
MEHIAVQEKPDATQTFCFLVATKKQVEITSTTTRQRSERAHWLTTLWQ